MSTIFCSATHGGRGYRPTPLKSAKGEGVYVQTLLTFHPNDGLCVSVKQLNEFRKDKMTLTKLQLVKSDGLLLSTFYDFSERRPLNYMLHYELSC